MNSSSGPGPFVVTYQATLTASSRAILIDLSDTTNFPHSNTGATVLHQLNIMAALTGTGKLWAYQIGVVVENDGTDGTVKCISGGWREAATVYVADRFVYPGNGLDLTVDTTNNKLVKVCTNLELADDANYKNDASLATPHGTNAAPAVGDLVLELTEVVDTGTLLFAVTAHYDTKA